MHNCVFFYFCAINNIAIFFAKSALVCIKILDKKSFCMVYSIILKTVEAEIKSDKTTQRARVAESRVRNCLSNGPRRVQTKGERRVFCNA